MLTISRIRIVSALVLSLLIHASIMNIGNGWLRSDKNNTMEARRVTMTLTARKPKTVVPPVEVIEEKAVVLEKEAQPVIEQKTIQKIEKIVVQEIPLPVIVPREEKVVVAPETSTKKSIQEPVKEAAVQELPASAPIAENTVQKPVAGRTADTLAQEKPVQEKPALLPVTLARPLYKYNPRPSYPSIARRHRYQGTTLLEVLVDSRGRVGELRVFQSSGYKVLDRAALTAVKDWSFEPGGRGDDKVDIWVRVPVRFQLR